MSNPTAKSLRIGLTLGAIVFGIAIAGAEARAKDREDGKRPKPWQIYLSAAAGSFAKAPFPQNFTLDSNRILWMYADANADNVNHRAGWSQANSSLVPVPTLGISFDLDRLFTNREGWASHMLITAYLEGSYLPAHAYPDGIELEAQHYWDAGQGRYIDQIVERSQTGRKGSAFGFAAGIVFTPYDKIPIGLDCKFGIWSRKQEYVSGTCLHYDGVADLSNLTDPDGSRGLGKYEGQGRWDASHTALAIGIGLKFRPWRSISLDLTWNDLMYFRNEATGSYYVSTGLGASSPEPYDLGSLWSFGLTYYF